MKWVICISLFYYLVSLSVTKSAFFVMDVLHVALIAVKLEGVSVSVIH